MFYFVLLIILHAYLGDLVVMYNIPSTYIQPRIYSNLYLLSRMIISLIIMNSNKLSVFGREISLLYSIIISANHIKNDGSNSMKSFIGCFFKLCNHLLGRTLLMAILYRHDFFFGLNLMLAVWI